MLEEIFVLFQDTGWEDYHEPIGQAVFTLEAALKYVDHDPKRRTFCAMKLVENYIPPTEELPKGYKILPPNQPPQFIAGYEDQQVEPTISNSFLTETKPPKV